MQKLLQEKGLALKDFLKITFCNSSWGIDESYATFRLLISAKEYALTEKALKYKFHFSTLTTKESARLYVLSDSRLTGQDVIISNSRTIITSGCSGK